MLNVHRRKYRYLLTECSRKEVMTGKNFHSNVFAWINTNRWLGEIRMFAACVEYTFSWHVSPSSRTFLHLKKMAPKTMQVM